MNWSGILEYMTGEGFKPPFSYTPPVDKDIESDFKVPKPPPAPGVVIEEFINRARDRRAAGVEEYRGGNESLPFNGDPLMEALDEAVDLYVYGREALDQELLSDDECEEIGQHALDVYNLIRGVQNRVKIREAQEPGNEED